MPEIDRAQAWVVQAGAYKVSWVVQAGAHKVSWGGASTQT